MIDVEESACGTRPDERVKMTKIKLDCDEQEQYGEGCRQMYGRKTAEPELNSTVKSRSDKKKSCAENRCELRDDGGTAKKRAAGSELVLEGAGLRRAGKIECMMIPKIGATTEVHRHLGPRLMAECRNS
jgi:hypothetical protein